MKSKLSIAVILGVLGLLTTMLVGLPMLSAEQGQAAILDASEGDETDWTNPDATIFIQVTDSDLNVAAKRVLVHSAATMTETALLETADSTDSDQDDAVHAEAVTLKSTTLEQIVFLSNFPILDSNVGDSGSSVLDLRFAGDPDTFVNRLDVQFTDSVGVEIPNLNVNSLSATDGVVRVQFSELTQGSMAVHALYWSAGVNTIGTASSDLSATTSIVQITSEADPVGIGIVLTETGPDTGIFESQLTMCIVDGCSASSTATEIEVSTEVNDTITVTYEDAGTDDSDDSDSISVESVDPEFSNLSPADGFATASDRPALSGDVIDADSGVADPDDGSIVIVMRLAEIDGDLLDTAINRDSEEALVVTDITGGHNVELTAPRMSPGTNDEFLIQWWIVATDVAGNQSVSDNSDVGDDTDLDSDTDTDEASPCTSSSFFFVDSGTSEPATSATGDFAGCDPFTVRVDVLPPSISSATTGNSWDSDEDVVLIGADAITTSIQVVFSEDLDGASVDLADFDSVDVDITDVAWFSDQADSVFLTVDAMDSDLLPTIDLVDDAGGVSDEAGNVNDDGDVDSDDGIPAGLTITVVGTAASRAATDEQITITISADEALTGTPNVHVIRIEDDSVTATTDQESGDTTKTGSDEWTAEFDVSSPGLYNVYVTGTDLGSRLSDLSTAGTAATTAATSTIDIDDDDVILFEVDTGVPAPATSPADGGETDDASPFITLDFSDEGLEYGLDASDDFTTTPAGVAAGEDFDAHGTVTITAATLDGDAVTFDTDDNIEFLFKASGLALGEHDVVLAYEDAVGNEVEEFTITFDVIERADFEIPLVPGWNLMSLPGAPADTSIDAVIGDTPVTAVYGYDPSLPGGWLVARRDSADDAFGGTLTDIDANNGYWVLTATFQALEVDIPSLAAGAEVDELPPQPPTIDIVAGWNLIPVRDVTGERSAGDPIASDVYTAGVEVSRLYGFNTVSNLWVLVDPEKVDSSGDLRPDDVAVGSAYWLFASASGTLVP